VETLQSAPASAAVIVHGTAKLMAKSCTVAESVADVPFSLSVSRMPSRVSSSPE
jgi:hypothetical protein